MLLYIKTTKPHQKTIRSNEMNSIKLQNAKSIYRSDAFLYTNNKLSGKEMKKTISFTITQQIKNTQVKCNQEVKRPVLGRLN